LGEQIRRFDGHDSPVRSVAFSPDGWFVLPGGDDGVVRLWRLAQRSSVFVKVEEEMAEIASLLQNL